MNEVKHFELNTKGNDYCVGDIHGCFDRLQQQLDEMGFNPEVDRLFSVGDLVDRGPDSEASVEWLAKPWFHAIAGNHEQMAIDAAKGLVDWEIYEYNGGKWFKELHDSVRQYYAEQFRKLPLAIEVETKDGIVGIVHGDAPPDWNMIREFHNHWLLWGRQRFQRKNTTDVANIIRVYCGHTPVKTVTQYGNVFFIDTGAVFGGELSIVKIGP